MVETQVPGRRGAGLHGTSTSARIALLCGLASAVAGLLTLVGWALNVQRFADWIGSGVTMKANNALCAFMGGIALALLATGEHRRQGVRALAIVAFVIAFLTLLEHLTGLDLRIDTLLFQDRFAKVGTLSPGRMGLSTSVCYILVAVGLFLAANGATSRRWASSLALAASSIALVSLVGYLYGASSLYALPRLTGVALQTALVLIALGAGVAAAIPEKGFVAALRRPDAGGVLLRRFVLPTILVPLGLGWLRLRGQLAGLYDPQFGAAVYSVSMVFCLWALAVWCAGDISRLTAAEKAVRDALAEANRELERRVESRTEALATKVRELEGFCYAVSHDMRTPLRAIVGNASITLEEDRDRLDPEGQARLTSLATAANKMGQLIDDLLAYARLGQAEVQRQPTDLSAMAESILAEASEVYGLEDLEIEIAPRIVRDCDPRLVRLVFYHLLDNALKYRQTDRRACVQVGETSDGAVFVRDNGIGFDMAYAGRIFRPFERLHRDAEYPGTGIGLANVCRIVESHGGKIWADSQRGQGTTFYFTLS